MTSTRNPDYDLGLNLAISDFQSMAGITFKVTVVIGKEQQLYSGKLIIPQGDGYPEISTLTTAWLWSDHSTNIPTGTHITITVGEMCDSMLTSKERTAMNAHTSLVIAGIVTMNWNIVQAKES